MTDMLSRKELMSIAGDIVAAYVAHNHVDLDNMQNIVQTVYRALKNVNEGMQSYKPTGPLVPAVPIDESVQNDFIVCLEDGKKLQMLKRHLSTVYNMTPEQYRERWGLPMEYPIVAPNYAKKRSGIAKTTGLGTTGRKKRKLAM